MKEETQSWAESSVQTSLLHFDHEERLGPQRQNDSASGAALVSQITFHDEGDLSALVERGEHAVTPSELVLAPVTLHRRVIKRRFAVETRPRDSLWLCRPIDVAMDLLEANGSDHPGTVDRIDRIPLLEELLEEHTELANRFQVIFGTSPTDAVKLVSQARTEIESITGYHPTRIDEYREWCQRQDGPVAADGRDLLESTVDLEHRLRHRTDRMTSTDALVRMACRELSSSDGAVWQDQLSAIERVWLCGVNTIPASLVDLLTCILTTTDADVHIYIRNASGAVMRERLPQLLGIDNPGREVFDVR